jgi:hypothetical protein
MDSFITVHFLSHTFLLNANLCLFWNLIMAIEGYVKFEYFSKGIPPYYTGGGFPDLLDDEKITIETPSLDMSYHQYAGLFKKFLMAVGFDEKNVMQAGCSLAFNEGYPEKLMREVAEEYDLTMSEDLPAALEDQIEQEREFYLKQIEEEKSQKKNWEQRYWALYRKVEQSSQYTDEELEAMCDAAEKQHKPWNGLTPGSNEALASGCTCPVMDNAEMPDDKKWVNSDCPIHGRNEN